MVDGFARNIKHTSEGIIGGWITKIPGPSECMLAVPKMH